MREAEGRGAGGGGGWQRKECAVRPSAGDVGPGRGSIL